jgi:sugar phosphate isomerase/epimerase
MINKIITRRHFVEKTIIAASGIAMISAIKKSQWQTGCFTRPWAQFDYREAFDGIAAAGFRYAGLMSSKAGIIISKDTTPDQARKVYDDAKSRGLGILSVYGGNFGAEKSIQVGIEGLKKLVDNTATCECPNLLLLGAETREIEENYYKAVAECCDYALSKKVSLGVKPHGPFNPTGSDCRKLVEKTNHKNFRVWYDPGNIYYYSDGNLNPVSDAASVDGLVAGMIVKDFRMPKDVDLTPGTGMVDFRGVLAGLKRGGFRKGPLIVECLAKGELSFINSEAKKAYDFVSKLLSE